MKKKTLTLLAAATAVAGSVVAAPAASAAGSCGAYIIEGNYRMTVSCPHSAPGTQYQVVANCPDGQRFSRWENQGYANSISMQCHGIRLADVRFR